MSESLIVYKLLRFDLIVTLVLSLLLLVGGFFIGQILIPVTAANLIVALLIFLCLPIIMMFLGFYLGWRAKSNSVEYSPPEWNYQPTSFPLDECPKRMREYNKQYSRVVAYSNFWFFFLPPILVIAAFGLAYYSFRTDSSLEIYIPLLFPIILFLTFLISEYGSYRASSNDASQDFTLPLVREAIDLAKTQSNIAGISKIHVVLDQASVDDSHVFKNPRVVARVRGIEKDAYIESYTEDIGAIERVLIRLFSPDAKQVVWWWLSRERIFRKFVGDDKDGYYVQNPVPTKYKELGVKDVKLVIQNAVALILIEWIKTHGRDNEKEEILTELGVGIV
jgi:hypothetical protein